MQSSMFGNHGLYNRSMNLRFRVLLLAIPLVFFGLPSESSNAITFGCRDVQKKVDSLYTNYIIFKNSETISLKRYAYQEAYRAYWNAQKNYQGMYDFVTKSPKCFKSSFKSNMMKSYSTFYVQVGACDRYGYQICSQWKSSPDLPCEDTRTKQDYIDCIEGQARPDYGYAD